MDEEIERSFTSEKIIDKALSQARESNNLGYQAGIKEGVIWNTH